MNKKGIEMQVIVIVIFALVLLVILLLISGQNFKWINAIAEKLFG